MNKKKKGHFKTKSEYLFSGHMICGDCGASYHGNTRSSGKNKEKFHTSYRCGRKTNKRNGKNSNSEVNKNALENFVLESMETFLFTDEAIKTIVLLVNEFRDKEDSIKSSDVQMYEKQYMKLKSK